MGQAVQKFRHRLAERGYKRVEVSLSARDAELVRRVAKALVNDGKEAGQLRQLFEEALPAKSRLSFNEWLATLPDE